MSAVTDRLQRVRKGTPPRPRPVPASALLVALVQARGGTCVNGHPWTQASAYVTPAGYRQCRACRAARKAAAP